MNSFFHDRCAAWGICAALVSLASFPALADEMPAAVLVAVPASDAAPAGMGMAAVAIAPAPAVSDKAAAVAMPAAAPSSQAVVLPSTSAVAVAATSAIPPTGAVAAAATAAADATASTGNAATPSPSAPTAAAGSLTPVPSSALVSAPSPASPFGPQAVAADRLATQRGGASSVTRTVVDIGGDVRDNTATNVATGTNVIRDGSFANSVGFSTVIQNSGANVLIQNSTTVNVQFR